MCAIRRAITTIVIEFFITSTMPETNFLLLSNSLLLFVVWAVRHKSRKGLRDYHEHPVEEQRINSRFLSSVPMHVAYRPSGFFSTCRLDNSRCFFLALRPSTSSSVHDVTGQRNGSPRCLCENRRLRNDHSLSPFRTAIYYLQITCCIGIRSKKTIRGNPDCTGCAD